MDLNLIPKTNIFFSLNCFCDKESVYVALACLELSMLTQTHRDPSTSTESKGKPRHLEPIKKKNVGPGSGGSHL